MWACKVMMFREFLWEILCGDFSVCISIRIHYWIDILFIITTNAQVEQSRLCSEEMKEILATRLDQVLGAKEIYLVDDWVITPWNQTLQSLGTIRRYRPSGDPMSDACIQIIEFSVNCVCDYIPELCLITWL